MVNLHYENLKDLGCPADTLMWRVYNSTRDYRNYFGLAKKMMWSPDRLKKVNWKHASQELLDQLSRNGSQQKYNSKVIWIELEETEEREDLDVIPDFCDADFLIEYPNPKAPRIRVLDGDPNTSLLLIEDRLTPDQNTLYIRPNDYVLNQQTRALINLEDTPEPEHRGILRLFEDSQRVRWPEVEKAACEEWEFLKDERIEGTEEQRRFIKIALGTPDFAILEGPPGSGKTTSICELIVQEIRRGHRVLLCASTHVAVDNVLESLQRQDITSKEVLAVRIGNEKNVSDSVKDFRLQNRAKKERQDIIKKLSNLNSRSQAQQYLLDVLQRSDDEEESVISRLILESANLVCGTTVGILQHPDIKAQNKSKTTENETTPRGERMIRPFDCMILDEASKTTFQEFLVPAMYCRKWILVGDVKQLSPYVEAVHIEDNVKGLIKPEDARVCLPVFQSWKGSEKRTQGLLVINAKEPEKYSQQAERLGLNVLNLDEPPGKIRLEMLGAHVMLTRKDTLEGIEHLIPSDVTVLPLESASNDFIRRHEYWLKNFSELPQNTNEGELLAEWSKELAWRLGRYFELRDDESRAKHYDDQITKLLPQWYDEETWSTLISDIETVKRIALPSTLELLQKGFGRRPSHRTGSSITDGIDKKSLSQRHSLLSYQHRMHPDISKFPRECIYESNSLKDPQTIKENRSWAYTRYNERAGWIQTIKGSSNSKNRNPVEADIVMAELRSFLQWATTNPKQSIGSNHQPWEVAILTFYREQETLLRNRLQQLFRNKLRTTFRTADGGVKINLCTVDRFQGHEADLVILSFVRNRVIGFLDSPNRLNVAITRARYQLVLVGNRKMFSEIKADILLKKLAEKLPTLRTSWGELSQ